ncbi:hypothetical protein KZ829_06450 [Actinoplanes hulinensis]|uniref:Uncharacterized protein n=1 Tax=Actinoplanes hulinensis TaxID=1144547 RepID=A0ABS7AXC4_9ACTN|nr:hypothetical protein [Actinoplanes hulinensis]MBW6433383.1 hypothetical protein [Actinoplanes hulinensis]
MPSASSRSTSWNSGFGARYRAAACQTVSQYAAVSARIAGSWTIMMLGGGSSPQATGSAHSTSGSE